MKQFQKQAKSLTGSALLLALLLSSVSCGSTGSDTPSAQTNQTTDTASVTTLAQETEPDHLDQLQDQDFGGAVFNMLIRTGKKNQIIAEEANGEVFNDAVYARNNKVEERFHVDIQNVTMEDDGATWSKTISSSVMAGDGAFDVVMPDYWWGCETGGYFLNLLDYSDIIDFSQPWWCAGWNDNAEIYGQLYTAVGSICMDLYENAEAVFFNKSLIGQFDMENPYTLVENKTWTLDKMLEMSASALADLNGDGVYDLDNDRFGAYFDLWSGRGILTSCGWKTATKTDDGKYAYEFYNDAFVEMYHKIYNVINQTPSVTYSTGDGGAAFIANRLLFLTQGVGAATNLRNMSEDFGIIPYPLYDENQENYITYNFGTSYMAIPKSAKDPAMSATILEALNAESYHTVKDAYYEVNLKDKYSRDTETQKMLDLIVDSCYFDFTFVNESATDHIVMYFFEQIQKKNDNISSAYEKRQKGFQTKLDKLFDTYAAAQE